jgi:adenylate kinase
MNLILLGAPGAGKGTQAENIERELGIPQISTGNILKAAVKNGTEIGLKAKSFMDAGALVPDEVVIGILKERIAEDDCKGGFILDGFPRTVPQADALDSMGIIIDKVISIEVPDEKIEARLSGRRACPNCGATYHMEYKKPKTAGKCDKCGADLVTRDDDKPETVRERLVTYHEKTAPLIEYYKGKGKLVTVLGREEVADTTAAVMAELA